MALTLPNGAIISIASTLGSAITTTAVTNTNPAVVTSAAHGLADGDIVHVVSGWSKLDGRVARVANSDTNTFELEGVDTSDTNKFPSGGGVGSVREVQAWTQISQIMNSQFSGGEPSFYNWKYLDDDTERQIPTGKSAQSMSLTLADDQEQAWFSVLKAADEARVAYPVQIVLPSGPKIYFGSYVAFNSVPSMTVDEGMTNTCSLSYASAVTRYAS